MAGNNSVRGDETITFTDNMSFDGTERGGKMTTNGQLWIGSTASRHVKLGSLTSPNSTISIGYSSPNITLDTSGPQSGFLGFLNTTVPNVTGDGTDYQIVYDSKVFDIDSEFSTSTGIFTAAFTGYYTFTWQITWNNISAGVYAGTHSIVTTGRTLNYEVNPLYLATASSDGTVNGSVTLPMTAGDTAKIMTSITGIGKVISVQGVTAGEIKTSFSGFLQSGGSGIGSVSSGNLVLIESQTVSGASSVTFTSGISSTYDDYVIRVKGLSGSGVTYLFGQFSIDSGATWINAAGYNNNGTYASAGGVNTFYVSGQTQMRLGDNVPGSAGNQMGGVIEFFDISSGSFMPVCLSRLQAKGGIDVLNYYGNAYNATLAVNGINIYPDAGTITGTFQLFGVVK